MAAAKKPARAKAPAKPKTPLLEGPGLHTVATPRGLNLRAAPGQNSPVIKVLPKGTLVQELPGAEAAPIGWLRVTDGADSGWVNRFYLEEV